MVHRLGPIEAPPSLDLLGPQGPEIMPLLTRPFLVLHRASSLYTARICLLLLFGAVGLWRRWLAIGFCSAGFQYPAQECLAGRFPSWTKA